MNPQVGVSTSFCHAPFFGRQTLQNAVPRPTLSLPKDPTGMTKTACAFRPPSPIISPSLPAPWPPARPRQSTGTSPETARESTARESTARESMARKSTDRQSMETQTGNSIFPSILALLSCIFTSLYAVPLPTLLPCLSERTRVSLPKSPSTSSECGQTFVAGSDTNVRPVRPLSVLKNLSSATTLPPSAHPYAPIFAVPQIRNVPQCGQTFVAVSDTAMRPMRPIPDTNNCVSATILAALATNMPPCPLFGQLRNLSKCDHPPQAGSDTTMRPVRPRPPTNRPQRPLPVYLTLAIST